MMNTGNELGDLCAAISAIVRIREQRDAFKALLKKIYDRANPSILEDNAQTRLDPDLLDEIENAIKDE